MQALGDKYYISTNKLKRKTILRKPEVSEPKLTLGLLLTCRATLAGSFCSGRFCWDAGAGIHDRL